MIDYKEFSGWTIIGGLKKAKDWINENNIKVINIMINDGFSSSKNTIVIFEQNNVQHRKGEVKDEN